MNGEVIKSLAFETACSIRRIMEEKYGYLLDGRCIEASEKIAEMLCIKSGVSVILIEGWCRFDNEAYGSDRPWAEHTWVEIPKFNLYIDVTADQFNFGMYKENEYPDVIVQEGLPYGMQYEEPEWHIE